MTWEEILKLMKMLNSSDEEIENLALSIIFANYKIPECKDFQRIIMTVIYLSGLRPEEAELSKVLAGKYHLEWIFAYL